MSVEKAATVLFVNAMRKTIHLALNLLPKINPVKKLKKSNFTFLLLKRKWIRAWQRQLLSAGRKTMHG